MALEFSQVVHDRQFDQSGTDELKLELSHFILDCKDMDHSTLLLSEISDYHDQISQVHAEIHQFLAPTMESNDGIALEGFGDTIKQYWEKLVAFLKRIWAKIVQFFELHFTILGRRRLYINRIIKKVKSLSTNPNTYQELARKGEIVIDGEAAKYFSIGDHFCKTAGELRQGLTKTREAVNFVTDAYSEGIAKRGELIESAIRDATVENAKAVLEKLTKDLTAHDFRNVKAEMLGDVSLKYVSDAGEHREDTHFLDMALTFVESTHRQPPGRFEAMGIEELGKVFQMMDATLAEIDAFKEGRYKEIVKHSTTMIASTDKFMNVISSYFKSKGADGQGDPGTYREIMSLNRVYLNWIKGPLTELIKRITAIFHFVSMWLEQNIAMYAPKPASNIFTVMGIA
jgi:hypothetical protein